MESYFSDDNNRPDFPGGSTACWRGYVGLWKIEGDRLFLVSLHEEDWDKPDDMGKEIPLKKIFRDQQPPILATWFTGVLRLPRGEKLRYVHMGYGSIFQNELHITIENGVVMAEQTVDNTGRAATRSTPDLE